MPIKEIFKYTPTLNGPFIIQKINSQNTNSFKEINIQKRNETSIYILRLFLITKQHQNESGLQLWSGRARYKRAIVGKTNVYKSAILLIY